MLNKSPAFQFYPDDWNNDINVISMTPEEEGHYIRLTGICWKEGYLPSDLESLQCLLKAPCQTLAKILKCFYENPKNKLQLLHKRLEKERKKQKAFRKKKSNAGKKGATKRWKYKGLQENKPDGTAIVLPLANDSSLVSVSNSVSNSKSKDKTHPPNPRVIWFEEDWEKYPRKEGNKPKSESCYLKTVTTQEKRNEFLGKMDAYVKSVDDPTFLKHGETFFRNWKALVVPKPKEKVEQPYIPPPEPKEKASN